MSKRWVHCASCGSLTRRDVSARKRKRCAECGVKAGIWANLQQHYGIGQGPGDKATKLPARPAEGHAAPGRGQSGERPAA